LLLLITPYRPAPGAAVFITLIVKNPIIQIFAMLLGFFMIALEFPIPQLKGMAFQRSFALKIVLLLFQAFICVLYYQVSGVVCVRLPDI
jgi:sulfate adenylyltransferase (ADP) / ATP adenylyltransferase